MNVNVKQIREYLRQIADHRIDEIHLDRIIEALSDALTEIEQLRFTLEEVATQEMRVAQGSLTTADFEDIGEIRGYEDLKRPHPLYPEARR